MMLLPGIDRTLGDPPDKPLSSQTTSEFSYRLQFSQGLAIIPSVQLLKGPVLNPANEAVRVWGIRFRLTL